MSEDAKADRPQVAAIGCRCMNSSTAWQAWLRRRSSRAQRMAWRMLVADNCGIMRAHSTAVRSEEHTSELQSLMRISYAVFCLKKKIQHRLLIHNTTIESIYDKQQYRHERPRYSSTTDT